MTMDLRRWFGAVASVSALLASPAIAQAQAPTARNAGEFEAHATQSTTDETRFRLQVGASLATGNTRSFNGNFAGRFLLRRGLAQLTIDGALNYGRAAVAQTDMTGMRVFGPDQTTAENYLGRGRVDLFFERNTSVYIGLLAFRDQPSGFNSRLSGQIGILRNFINLPDRRRFWGEVGYDATYENLNSPTPVMGANCTMTTAGTPDCWRFLNLARLFLGFEEHATASLDLTAGIEGLMNVLNPSDFRVNGTVGLASKLGDDFSLALTLTARYIHEPINGRDPLDTITLVSVIYQRAFEVAPPAAPVVAGGGR
jgi:hypothetical protein